MSLLVSRMCISCTTTIVDSGGTTLNVGPDVTCNGLPWEDSYTLPELDVIAITVGAGDWGSEAQEVASFVMSEYLGRHDPCLPRSTVETTFRTLSFSIIWKNYSGATRASSWCRPQLCPVVAHRNICFSLARGNKFHNLPSAPPRPNLVDNLALHERNRKSTPLIKICQRNHNCSYCYGGGIVASNT